MHPLDETITNAINEQRRLAFDYDGRKRVVEPHAYGVRSDGERMLEAFQIDGYSSRELPNWRDFNLLAIENLEILEDRFQKQRSFSIREERWSKVFAKL